MSWSVDELAQALGTEALGNGALRIARAREPSVAGPTDLALAMSATYAEALERGQARVAILWPDADWQALGLEAAIKVPRARLAMARITQLIDPGPSIEPGVHASAVVHPEAKVPSSVSVGPFAVIEAGVTLGADSYIGSHVSVGAGSTIGPGALIHAGVRIGTQVSIGARFVAQPGAVIGGDGFSFVTPEESGVERARKTVGHQGEITPQSWHRIHSLGSVSIGDDVEIGANTCIDKGTLVDTQIGDRTKLDNLVHIGHNNRIGADCLICGQVGMAGSSVVGDRVVLGGQVGVNDNIEIGDDVVAGGASKIFTRVKPGAVILGYPAVQMSSHMQMYRALRRLPKLAQTVTDLKKSLFKSTPSD